MIYPKKFIVGLCGNIDTCLNVLEFFENPTTFKLPKGYKECEFVALTEDHKIYTFIDPRKWLEVNDKFYSIGSGCHFAMGAMQTGLSPLEAVKAACKLDRSSGMGITYYTM